MENFDSRLWNLMSRGYNFEMEYLGHEKFIYHLKKGNETISQWFSYKLQDIDELESRAQADWRDRVLQSVIKDNSEINIVKST